MEVLTFLFGVFLVIIFVLLVRLFGAWMLRIDEVIKQQKLLLKEIKKLTNNNTNEN